MSVLIVIADAREAAAIPDRFDCVLTGMGKTAAAIGSTRAILERRPSKVINIGTAGALHDGLSGVFDIGTVVNHDMNAATIRALGAEPRERIAVSESPYVLASGDLFVDDAATRRRLAERHHLVDMEAYGVALACQEFGVPVRVVKHVSDAANETAANWPRVVSRSAEALADWLRCNTG